MALTENESLKPKRHNILTDIVIGISDGLIIPFAVITGFSALASGTAMLVKVGVIVVITGALFMALAGYFAAKNRREHLAQRTAAEEERMQQEELEKTLVLFKQLDLGKEMEEQASGQIDKDSREWKAYLDEHLHELTMNEPARLPATALIIGISYIIAGIIPLLPYIFTKDIKTALPYSIIMSLVALLLFGYLKSRVNKEPLIWGSLRLMLLGAAAAGGAFAVANVFVAT